jgi:hypothetical protein
MVFLCVLFDLGFVAGVYLKKMYDAGCDFDRLMLAEGEAIIYRT